VLEEREGGLARDLPFEIEQRALRKDGQYRWLLLRYNPFRDESRNSLSITMELACRRSSFSPACSSCLKRRRRVKQALAEKRARKKIRKESDQVASKRGAVAK
jgi:hypothetical protein